MITLLAHFVTIFRFIPMFSNIFEYLLDGTDMYSELYQISKMERFSKIVNGFQQNAPS